MAITQPGNVSRPQAKETRCDNQCEPLFTRAQAHVLNLDKDIGSKAQGKQGLWDLGQSPIIVDKLCGYLERYNNYKDAQVLREGFQRGFRLNYLGSRKASISDNLKSAFEHEQEMETKLQSEINLGRIAGPFNEPPIANLKISPIGLVPKSDGGWRLITHLSYPTNNSINDGIPELASSVKYTSFDKVSDMIFSLGKNALLAKRDIKSAFRLLPVHPSDFALLGMKFKGKYFYDKMMPMGCSISCNLFEKFSSFIHWLVIELTGLSTLDHMLDDFIFAGAECSNHCSILVRQFESICAELGIPLATEKSVGPTTVLVFLGFEIDTVTLSIRIPENKVNELLILLQNTVLRNKMTLKELQSMTGKLMFFSKAIRSSRAFLRRFYDAMIGLSRAHYRKRISKDMRDDMYMWINFLESFNGVVHIPDKIWHTSQTLQLYTDSAGGPQMGAACYLRGKWSFFQWPIYWDGTEYLHDLTFLELVPVLLAFTLWKEELGNKKVLMWIDNEALVAVINKQSSKSKRVMFLLRELILLSMQFNIIFKAQHISSVNNGICDAISRKQWSRFRTLAPEANETPEEIPHRFQRKILSMKSQGY